MNVFSQDVLWAKRDAAGRWHSLVGHSADVSAALAALLDLPLIGTRLQRLGRVDEAAAAAISAKLSALAFLHDIGKANRGFQARSDADALRVGHIDELAWVFSVRRGAEAVCDRLYGRLGLDRVAAWLPGDYPGLFHAVFAHHGRPWALGGGERQADVKDASAHWRDGPDDPVAKLAPMRAAFDAWFGNALADASPLPDHAAFEHAFAGLLMLADWLGSNPSPDFFPFDEGRPEDRMAFAQVRSSVVLSATGLDARPARAAACRVGAGFAQAFAQPGRPPFVARPIQAETARHRARLLVLEAETGSGKTEAALWRFSELLRQGASTASTLPCRPASRPRRSSNGPSDSGTTSSHPTSGRPSSWRSRARCASTRRRAPACPISTSNGATTVIGRPVGPPSIRNDTSQPRSPSARSTRRCSARCG